MAGKLAKLRIQSIVLFAFLQYWAALCTLLFISTFVLASTMSFIINFTYDFDLQSN